MDIIIRFARLALARVSITALNVAVIGLLSHAYGLEVVGKFSSYLAYASISAIVASYGIPSLLLRKIASNQNEGLFSANYWRKLLLLLTYIISVPISGLSFLVLTIISPDDLGFSMLVAGLLAPSLGAVIRLWADDLRAVRRTELATLIEFAAPSLTPMVAIVALIWLRTTGRTDLDPAMVLIWVHLVTSAALALAYTLLVVARPSRRIARGLRAILTPRRFLTLSYTMMVLSGGAALTSAPVLLLYGFGSASEAGAMAVIQRIVGLSATATSMVQSVMSAPIVKAFRQGVGIRRLYVEAAILNGLANLLALGVPALAPVWVLKVFGLDTSTSGQAVLALQILVWGRLLRAFLGINDQFLILAGKSGLEAISLATSVATFFGIILALMMNSASPQVGLVGMSVAIIGSVWVRVVVSYYFSQKLFSRERS